MDAVKILVIFLGMFVVIFKYKKSLTLAFALGCIAVAAAYQFELGFALKLAARSAFSKSTLAIVAIYYTVTFLQKMMEARGHIALAEASLLGITNSKRSSAALAPICAGLMPTPGAVIVGGAIVESIYKDSVSNEDKNFITSYYRHIPESFVPTFGSVILACELAKVPPGEFVFYMLPLAFLLIVLGHVMFMRKLPWETGLPGKRGKIQDVKNLFLSLWPVGVIIVCVLLVRVDVYIIAIFVIAAYFFVNKLKIKGIMPLFIASFESKLILSTVFIFIFKDYIFTVGAVESLSAFFSELPLPDYIIFSLIFFTGSVLVGATGIVAIGMPLAYAAIPDGGVPLLVLLSSMAFAAMQISISHICLFLSSTFFKVEVASLIKRTIPVMAVFCALLVGYYLLLDRLKMAS